MGLFPFSHSEWLKPIKYFPHLTQTSFPCLLFHDICSFRSLSCFFFLTISNAFSYELSDSIRASLQSAKDAPVSSRNLFNNLISLASYA